MIWKSDKQYSFFRVNISIPKVHTMWDIQPEKPTHLSSGAMCFKAEKTTSLARLVYTHTCTGTCENQTYPSQSLLKHYWDQSIWVCRLFPLGIGSYCPVSNVRAHALVCTPPCPCTEQWAPSLSPVDSEPTVGLMACSWAAPLPPLPIPVGSLGGRE